MFSTSPDILRFKPLPERRLNRSRFEAAEYGDINDGNGDINNGNGDINDGTDDINVAMATSIMAMATSMVKTMTPMLATVTRVLCQVTGEESPGVGHQLPYCQAVVQVTSCLVSTNQHLLKPN